jgi:hypothetical protein
MNWSWPSMKALALRVLVLVISLVILAASVGLASGEVTQSEDLRVSFDGKIIPHALPRTEQAPVTVIVKSQIATTGTQEPPKLLRILLAINRNGEIDYRGLPKCHFNEIQPSNDREALKACRSALVGEGHFSAEVLLPEQSPFPSEGRILAFNGEVLDHPVIFAHIYGRQPVPTSFVLPFVVRHSNGRYATTLVAYLPKIKANWGFIRRISLRLSRLYRYQGQVHSYLSAACAAPKGFNSAVFSFARSDFVFVGKTLTTTLVRTCSVKG